MASFEVNGRVIVTCEFCGGETGYHDFDSIVWSPNFGEPLSVCLPQEDAKFCCSDCVRRMGLPKELILPCGLCQLPVLGTPEMIAGHDYEYCTHCSSLLRKAGFEIAFDDRR